MSPSKLVAEGRVGLGESENQRDARIEQLWFKLDPGRTGELDLKGLQRAFRKIDHPMKNADDMLKKILKEVDTNGDGKIQYEEFRVFVQHAEQQLSRLFSTIDRNGDGRLDVKELQAAFRSAGLTVANARLTEFFNDLDMNNDGFVTFSEWRDFLLFMPAKDHASQLRAVLSYYNSVVNVTPEGDTLVGEDTLQGLEPVAGGGPQSRATAVAVTAIDNNARRSREGSTLAVADAADVDGDGGAEEEHRGINKRSSTTALDVKPPKKFRLTDFIPDPGYFVAGAIAGGVSRTATAPLDRLKVYLLVNTSSAPETAAKAIKSGRVLSAAQHAARPFKDAIKDIFRSGGLAGFFAGNGLNVAKIMPETAIKFGSYEAAKRALANFEGHGDIRQISSVSKFTAGGVAGMVAQFCVYPLDTLKFRLQCETVEGGLKGRALVRQTAAKMWADGGMRSCYRGVTMGLIGMFPYSAIDMGMFELLKKTYRTYYARYAGIHEDDANPGNVATGIIGASSGAFGASVVYPLNVVRTRLQTQGTVMHRATYTGIWDVTQKTIQREGYRGLYKGLTPNILKVAPALSITWVVYENSKKMLGLH
ncbi:calcium dependent mitochondrial carrier protein [Emericellopsis cladophorae]|uniref:Mitochondrial thiamine pyrophosphate carrier 1 n=1 Tax=Emericellopsis cladophorae TaxID=2686198 RepID=A0A9Q0BGG4_9HYPO|nr:calcium dependent mitochondrial carrier protein [Emericellopsis cladophorae]KAI6783680.1 calcium dependent mitochondrial carrier protein [Emericellopsis cladophorae]